MIRRKLPPSGSVTLFAEFLRQKNDGKSIESTGTYDAETAGTYHQGFRRYRGSVAPGNNRQSGYLGIESRRSFRTASLPKNWQSRLISIKNKNTNNIEGLCLSQVDLAVSKLIAGREKEIEFVKAMISFNIVSAREIRTVSSELPEPLQRRLLASLPADQL